MMDQVVKLKDAKVVSGQRINIDLSSDESNVISPEVATRIIKEYLTAVSIG